MPDPFRHYEGVPVLDLPADPPAPEIPALEVLQGGSGGTLANDGPTFLSQLLFYSAAISASKRVPSTGYKYALRVNPSSGNLHHQVEITVHLIIKESADTRRSQPERFGGEIKAMTNSARLEMHIKVTAVAMRADGAIDIGDHRERHAGVTGEVLPKAQARGRDALVA